MITALAKTTKNRREFNYYISYFQKLIEENKEFTCDLVNGEMVNIFPIMADVVSIYASNIEYNIAPHLTRDDIVGLHKELRRIGNGHKVIGDTKDTYKRVSEIANPFLFGTRDALGIIANTNTKVAASIVFESILISQLALPKTGFICMTYFSLLTSIINHWAVKNQNKPPKFNGNSINNMHANGIGKYKKDSDEVPDDAIEFIKEIHSKECYDIIDTVINNLFNNGTYINLYTATTNTVIDVAEHIKKQSKKHDGIASVIEEMKDSILEKSASSNSYLLEYIDKRQIRNCIYAAASTFCDLSDSNIPGLSGVKFNSAMIDTYILTRYRNGDKILLLADDELDNKTSQLVIIKSNEYFTNIYSIMAEFSIFEADRFTMVKRENANLSTKVENLEAKSVALNKDLKRTRKELKNSERNIEDLEKRCKKLERDSASTITAEEMRELQAKLRKSEAVIDSKVATISELNRVISKRDREIGGLSKKLAEIRAQHTEAVQKYTREKDKVASLHVMHMQQEIPIESYINAIMGFKIALIGGDMMFNRLINEYGLTNIKTYKAGCRNIGYEDISDMDLVVTATAFLDHSTEESAMNVCRTHKIKCMKFSNKNADMLIYNVFNEMYR